MSLANKALIVNLTISQWTGRKFDRDATGTVQTTYATQGKVGQYTKKLLPGAKELEEISRIASSIRQFLYSETLPWAADGARILSSKNYLDFVREFAKRKGEYDHAVAEFLREYPNLRDHARAKLGSLFKETEYPTAAQLAGSFVCEIQFYPMPDVGDFRVEILDSEKQAFLERMRKVESNAMRECWTRLHDVVATAAARLSEPGAIFRDSLIENIGKICELLPKLNVTDDPQLETMRQSVEKIVSGISPEDCRKNQDARTVAARALDDITAKMGAYMGGI
jgi:hypothetical protein